MIKLDGVSVNYAGGTALHNTSIALTKGECTVLLGHSGAGKTTFTQGLLRGLGIKGAVTSPTFNIIKVYNLKAKSYKLKAVFHIDAYRVRAKDVLDLGWKDFAGKPDSIVIVEWAERIKKIIPTNAVWIKFEWLDEKKRKISLK